MNDPARQALELAAAEFDRTAAAVETEADLWREAAQHARRGEVALAIDASRRAALVILRHQTNLALDLVKSIEHRDPEEWGRVKKELEILDHDQRLHLLGELTLPELLLFLQVHQKACSVGSGSCCLIRDARSRIASWRS